MSSKLIAGKPEEVGMSEKRIEHVKKLAKNWVDQGIHPSLVVIVARKGIIVLQEAFGRLTHAEDSPPLKLDSIFLMASISKPITATLAMILVEDGLLGLNRPVSWYIPEFKGKGKDAVMVHHLLTHTAGINISLDQESKKKREESNVPDFEATQHPNVGKHLLTIYDAPLWRPPGQQMKYSSHGYELVGEIVRRVSGKSVEDFARERLFDPLRMKDTFYVVPESVAHRIVKLPPNSPKADNLNRKDLLTAPWGAFGVFSTAIDMVVFGQMFLNCGIYGDTRILSPATVHAMTRNQIPGISARYGDQFFPEASWGFGWSVKGDKKCIAYAETLQSPETFCHSGLGNVFLWVDPVYEIVGCYFGIKTYDGIPSHFTIGSPFFWRL